MIEKHWSQIRESTNTLGIHILLAMFRLGGRFLFFATLWPVVLFFWLFSGRARRASRDYLQRMARFTTSPMPGVFATVHHIWRFADTILDKLLAVSGFFPNSSLFVEGAEELTKDPRGAVLVTAHTGCPELCQMMSTHNGASKARHVHVLVHTEHAERFNAIIAKLNPSFALHHTEVSRITPQTAIKLAELVNAGHWVVVVADRTPIHSQASARVVFLGEPAPIALGPFMLAQLLECPIWSMICTRDTRPGATSRYRVRFSKITEPQKIPRNRRTERLTMLAQIWTKHLETLLVESPLDWFNFFDFWQPADIKNSDGNTQEQSRTN